MRAEQRRWMAQNRIVACLSATVLLGAAAAAQAAAPAVITITGTVGGIETIGGDVNAVAFDTSAWLNQPFTLVMQPDITAVGKVSESFTELPDAVFNAWAPANIRYSLTVGGVPLFVGTDNQFSELATSNDLLVPPDTEVSEVPIGIVAGGTYDLLEMRFSGIDLGCVTPGANGACAVYQYGTVNFSHAWDTAVGQGLTDGEAPDLLNTSFANGLAGAWFVIGRATVSAGGDIGENLVYLPFQVEGVAVTAVPEPASVAMLLAGLASLGALRARRRR